MRFQIIYIQYVYVKTGPAFNNQQWLICHQTKPNEATP